jgi:hypothetical protein
MSDYFKNFVLTPAPPRLDLRHEVKVVKGEPLNLTLD